MQITIRYGLEQTTKTVADGTTVGQVTSDANLRAVLGFGDNVRALLNGVQMTSDVQIPNGATLVLETACNTKAN